MNFFISTYLLYKRKFFILNLTDEYTRITTPRQDVLFKKGYLSRVKSKTATNSTENNCNLNSNCNNTSDPDSSTISTLSPATTPSIMESGTNGTYPVSPDLMDYPGIYYPGYYDENGVLVVNRKFEFFKKKLLNYIFLRINFFSYFSRLILKRLQLLQRIKYTIYCFASLFNALPLLLV